MHCSICKQEFVVTVKDQAFYDKLSFTLPSVTQPNGHEKISIPLPTYCPDCRRQRRLAFRNETNLYQRSCDLCHESMISIYSADKQFPVYCKNCFWSDRWTPLDYGQDFDFSRPFFAQFKTLFERVPRLGLILADSENSDYNNSCANLKNCYLCFDGGYAEDCYYLETFDYVKNCVNCLFIQKSELCYECINCVGCYNLQYSRFSQNCSDSYFLMDCMSCKHCFGCSNLRQKEYCWFNEQLSAEEYQTRLANFSSGSFEIVENMKRQVEEFWQSTPKRAYRGRLNDNVSGDNIDQCHNSFENFDCSYLEDCNYCDQVILPAKDCQDIDKWGENTSLCYNSSGVGSGAQHVIASYYCAFNSHDIYHSAFCWFGCSNLFGCVSLNRQKNHCILNKQYSQAEYEKLLPQIINCMISSNEWAEFFPPALSPFSYHETVAQEYYPLTELEALDKGFNWSNSTKTLSVSSTALSSAQLPDTITDVSDAILAAEVTCSSTGRLFRITKQELQFYRTHNIPLPRLHPHTRNAYLKSRKKPRQLWDRNCQQCGRGVTSSYSLEREEIVYCEDCYSQVVN